MCTVDWARGAAVSIDRKPGIPTIRVSSTTASHHMTVEDLVRFSDDVRQAVREGLDPQARIEDHQSNEMHLIRLTTESEAVDPRLCGIAIGLSVIGTRCKRAKGHVDAHNTQPDKDDT